MIIGFGFGSPLMALLMLIITASLSYFIFKAIRGRQVNHDGRFHGDYIDVYPEQNTEEVKAQMRDYYQEQRRHAREMMREYDLTDEEIEKRIEQEMKK
ncbi:hypothetical protein LPY66_08280 [Dehalobacter sp. DCM]|uniref:hypothetical protein n=1 Tax=Dehalobacter sp. DCM TaxID=2907827 RepID=UPI003081937A|nr:hypothetical protein LPY66_08280 [Dehalobacter sp. DCM]